MMVKFISKASNYSIVLKHGVPAEPLSGRTAVPGTYVKFEGGVVSVPQELAELMKQHPRYNADFICAEENDSDPYSASRKDAEPGHVITNLKYGQAEGVQQTKDVPKFSPEQMKFIREMVQEAAMPLAKEMAKEMLSEVVHTKTFQEVETGAEDAPETGAEETVTEETVVEETVLKTDSLTCPKCGKTLKNKSGLLAHSRSCNAQ